MSGGLFRKRDPISPASPLAKETMIGNTMIALRNTYGAKQRWTNLSVQEVALRIRNSEPIPLIEGDWLSPWNVDTFVSNEKFLEMVCWPAMSS